MSGFAVVIGPKVSRLFFAARIAQWTWDHKFGLLRQYRTGRSPRRPVPQTWHRSAPDTAQVSTGDSVGQYQTQRRSVPDTA
eukprot:3932948-Rhodomonas_salina.1